LSSSRGYSTDWGGRGIKLLSWLNGGHLWLVILLLLLKEFKSVLRVLVHQFSSELGGLCSLAGRCGGGSLNLGLWLWLWKQDCRQSVGWGLLYHRWWWREEWGW